MAKQKVFSLPCVTALVGSKQLRKPSDAGYDEFWVDFNIGSERLTLFCEQDSLYSQNSQMDEELWETVAIYKTDVQQCSCLEVDGLIELEICLKSPVCNLYPSQHQDVKDNRIKIHFKPELEDHIAHAVGCTFDFSEKRSKVSTVQTPLQISMKDVQDADSQSKMNYQIPNSAKASPAQTGSQESACRRRKVSVPSIPMKITALPDVLSSSCNHTAVNGKSQSLRDETEKLETVIPDSLPFSEDNICTQAKAKTNKASISVGNGLDDSGIGVDESRSAVVCDAVDISEDNKAAKEPTESSLLEKIDDANRSSKNVKGKAKKNAESRKSVIQNKSDINDFKIVEQDHRGLTPLKEVSEDENIFDERKKNTRNNCKNMKDTKFGFDSLHLEEVVESVPDSLENQFSYDIPSSEKHNSETKPNSKRKKQKKSKKNKITDKTNTEEVVEKESISVVDEVADNSSLANKENAVKSNVKERNEIQKKKSFTDIDKSLKELQDLDNKEDNTQIEVELDDKSGKSESLEDGKKENLCDLYNFSDPDPEFCKPEKTKSKVPSTQHKKTKNATIDRKSDTGKHKNKEKGKTEKHKNKENGNTEKIYWSEQNRDVGYEDKTVNQNVTEKIQNNRHKQDQEYSHHQNELVRKNSKEKDKIRKDDSQKQVKKDPVKQNEIAKQIVGKTMKIEKPDRPKQGKKDTNIQNKLIEDSKKKRLGKADRFEKAKDKACSNDFNESNTSDSGRVLRRRRNQSYEEVENNTEESSSPSYRNESKESSVQSLSTLSDLVPTGKSMESPDQKTPDNSPSKYVTNEQKIKSSLEAKDEACSNDFNESNTSDSGRVLRRRRNQSYEEVENNREESSSPSYRNDSKESSVQSLSTLSDLVPTEKSLESPDQKTPDNSPSKYVTNEQKIKSSLKKTKNSTDSVKENNTNKKKSKVSFDLPNSESQENDTVTLQDKEKTNDKTESKDERMEKNVLTTKCPGMSNNLFNFDTTEVKENVYSETEDEEKTNDKTESKNERMKNNVLTTKCQDMSNNLLNFDTTELEEYVNSETEDTEKGNRNAIESRAKSKHDTGNSKSNKEGEDKAEEKYVACNDSAVDSQESSSESCDSLYVERDDSYNARRYKMENGSWSTSKQKRRSSVKAKSKKSISKSKRDSSSNENQFDSLETEFKEIENKNDQDISEGISDKEKEKSKKKNRKSRCQAKESKNTPETEATVVHREPRLNKPKTGDRNNDGDSKYNTKELDKLSKFSDESMVVEDWSYLVDKEMPGIEPNQLCKESNRSGEKNEKQFDSEVNESQLAVLPMNDYQNFRKEKLRGNVSDKKRRSSDRKKAKNLTYTMKNSFEKMDCEDSFAASQHSIHTVSNAKGRSMIFQMSYLKSKTNCLNKRERNTEKPNAKEPAYDPYDFEAHCENASMASEKIGRKDISKELNSKHRKSSEKIKLKTKDCKDKFQKSKSLLQDSQDSFSKDSCSGSFSEINRYSEQLDHKFVKTKEKEQSNRIRKKTKSETSKTDITPSYEDRSMELNNVLENSSQEMVKDLQDEVGHSKYNKSKKTSLVQDQKTKRWYRTDTDEFQVAVNNIRKDKKRTKDGKGKTNADFPSVESFKKSMVEQSSCGDDTAVIDSSSIEENSITEFSKILKGKTNADFPSVESFKKSMVEQSSCGDDTAVIDSSSIEENSIAEFSKILKELTAGRGNFASDFNMSINENDFNMSINENDDSTEIKTPCIIGSLSSTPKVGSGKRKHYRPLNISVIKTPQSCEITESCGDGNSKTDKCKQRERKLRTKMAVKYKDVSESENGNEMSDRMSRISMDTISLLDSTQNITNRSEKSWILERRKTPKPKKSSKTYKASKKNRIKSEQNHDNSVNSEESSEDEQLTENADKLQKVREYLQYKDTPLTIPSLSLNSPAGTPSFKSLQSYEDPDEYILTPPSPKKHNRKKNENDSDIEMEQGQENCALSLNVSSQNSDRKNSFKAKESRTGLDARTQRQVQSEDSSDDERSVNKILQQNMKLLLGDSGFASGPSSEVRPTRSSLKRKFPENSNIVSSSSSQVESSDEMERSVFVPKKLFKFDPAVNTPQAKSLYSDATEENESDFGFQSGLSTVMAAFGADIQNHLKSKKQKIERFTKETLKETQKHFHHTVVEQHQYLSNLKDDFGARMLLELTALEKDIQRLNEAENKMEDFFKCQLDALRSNEDSQKKRLNNMKKLQSSFVDKSKKVTAYNLNVHRSMQEQLKKDMAALKRKLISETQRQEYMDVKMKLQKLF